MESIQDASGVIAEEDMVGLQGKEQASQRSNVK